MSNDGRPFILVVDDNPAGRYATSRVLRAAGFEVLEAETGADAVSLAPQSDLVVLDVNLPDISGFEVCRRIRGSPKTRRIPVIHLSASFVKDADKVEGLDAGADGYLTHPVEPPVLVATVNAFLRTRRAEEEMRRSEATFKAIFDRAPSGILLLSDQLVCLEANPAVCRMVGRGHDEVIGRHASSFVPAGYEHDTTSIVRELAGRGAWTGELPLIRADGNKVELEWSISHHSVPGVLLAVLTDVTERRAHEAERDRLLAAERAARQEAERANRLKDEFLATLSHELRTPLNAIVGWAQLLKQDPDPDDITEGLDSIDRNARAQAQLIADLLDVSRITSGKIRLDVRPIDPAATIAESLEAVASAAQAKGIRLERHLDPNAGPIHGDPSRLQQVVWNLVNNAVKFTPKGGTIRVSLAREEAAGGGGGEHVRIAVADNGQGISTDFLPFIFERFRQEDASTKRNQGGLGLGLAIVKHLVEMHGGTVAAHSQGEGRGATFVVRLPTTPARPEVPALAPPGAAADAEAPAASTTAAAVPISLRGARVLVVDDDDDARAVLCRVFRRAGADVAEAADVAGALRSTEHFHPNLLVSDIGMPIRDGYDLIREVRRQGHAPESLPAIALTAFARSEDQERSLAAGFQAHLAKPVVAADLLSAAAALIHLNGTKQ